ncbi:acetylcholinesterase-like isoform X4 [Dermacentor albipictus]|uniref:acetylcholinesterase-like isoform X4 n=1 Tax=Dermacentor albipictus TaxID=60249 RepID=UPI0031FE2FB3
MQTQFIASSKGRAERVQAAKATFTYRWWHGVAATNLIVFTAYFFFVIFVEVHKEPEANLDIGTVYGRTFKNLEVSAFYGVPYAKPPLGFHRFRRPEPMPAGSLSLDGRNPRYPCVQHNLYYGNITLIDASNVSEDCLHLDVYTPTTSSAYEQLRGVGGLGVAGHSAVLVALIDLNFASGGNSYFFSDPRHFVNQTGVVVVVPNYRLGAMGFMRSGKQRAAGNMGLLDQVLVGNVRNEGGMLVAHEFRNLTYKELHTTSRDEITQRLLKYLEPYHIPHLEKIIRCYLANPEKGQQLMNFIDVASELLGDLLYVCPMKRFANLFSDAGNRVNYFVYDYQPEAVKSLKPFHKDATQLDDVLTVFGAQLFPSEMLFSHTIMKHWGDFAKSGDLPSLKGGRPWPPYTRENPRYVFLSNRGQTTQNELATEEKDHYRDQLCKYWDDYLNMQATHQQPNKFPYKCDEITST